MRCGELQLNDPSKAVANQSRPPHVYGTAEEAYNELLTTGRNQAIILAGESGAGKTVACRLIMEYLLTTSTTAGSGSAFQSETGDRVSVCLMQSNVVLEALGNAKTIHNSNARYGTTCCT